MRSAQVDRFVHERLPLISERPEYLWGDASWPHQPHLNVVQALFDRVHASGFADRAFLRSSQRVMTYQEAQAAVNRLSAYLRQGLNLVPGNRVLLRGSNSIAMALNWLAVVNAGLIAVSTMPLLRAKELMEVIDKAKPSLALCEDSLFGELEMAHASCPLMSSLLSFDRHFTSGEVFSGAASFESDPQFCPTSPTDIALLAFTSGTTGKPKVTVHRHLDVMMSCTAWPEHALKACADDVVMGSPPLAFTFGLGGLLIFPMYAGSSIFYPDGPYRPESMVEMMKTQGCTVCYTAPTFYRQMAPLIEKSPVQSLRLCVSAGEALPLATREGWLKASGLDLIDGIGSTEMFHIFVSSRPGQLKPGALGLVVPGYEARVVDSEGHELPRGQVGRLSVRGPTGCQYMEDTRQARYVQGGWNYPGDLFFQDDEGYFFYQSRDDDMIITSGYNVAAPEVEDAMLQHPLVAECAVVGQSDLERGMIVKAYCVVKAGVTPSDALKRELQDHVKSRLAPYKYPREIDFLEHLPRTETGKLQRFKLKQSPPS